MYRRIILSLILPFCLLILLFSLIAETAVQALPVRSITSDTIWSVADSPHVITEAISIEPGVTLTIEAGAEVLFEVYAPIMVEDGARIEAVGTEIAPILFSSVSNTGPGDWVGISIYGSGKFVHTEFRNSGFNLSAHCRAGGLVIVEDSIIHYSNEAMRVLGNSLHCLQMSNVQFANNDLNQIVIYAFGSSSTLSQSSTLHPQPGLEGYSVEGDAIFGLTIPENVTLTVEAGVTLFHDRLSIEGHLQVNGTMTNPVTMTTKNSNVNQTFLDINESGSLLMNHAIIDTGSISLQLYGESDKQVVLKNTVIRNDNDYHVGIRADALHRLQMDNVMFDGLGLQTVAIEFGNRYQWQESLISENVTLTDQTGLDGYLVDGTGEIPEGITLTMEAGTSLLFDDHSFLNFFINGHLQMNGTVTNPVTITTVAEDVQFDISVSETGSVLMQHGMIKDSGGTVPLAIFGSSGKEVRLENSLISNNDDYLVVVDADALHRLQMDNLTFAGLGQKGVAVDFDGSSYFDPITMTKSVALQPQPGLDAYFFDGDLKIPENLTLTLEAGVNVQIQQDSQALQVGGTLVSHGTVQNPVHFFTGRLFSSQSDYWDGIQVNGGDVKLDYTRLEDASIGVHAISGTVQIENSQIISSTQVGMLVEGGTVTAVCTQFRNNQTAGIQVPESASPTISISQSVFEGNGVGVWNLGDTAVSAINNWWGSTAGPQIGTDVIGDVTIEPWLLWEPECVSDSPVYETYLPLVIRP